MTYRRLYTGHLPSPSCFALFLLSLVTLEAFGCASVSYKFGGTHGDYQAARDRCRSAGRGESPEFERCMKEQDWIVTQLGAPAAPREARKSVPAEGASASARVQPPPVAGDVAPSSKPSEASRAEQPIVVKAWFKPGGTAGELEAAKERCVAKLGAAHRPDPESHIVTGEMLDCLRDEGWRGFQSR
jgi:hypothetical protein